MSVIVHFRIEDNFVDYDEVFPLIDKSGVSFKSKKYGVYSLGMDKTTLAKFKKNLLVIDLYEDKITYISEFFKCNVCKNHLSQKIMLSCDDCGYVVCPHCCYVHPESSDFICMFCYTS